MTKILTTKGSSAALEDILLKAEKEVFLISYSYIISESFLKIFKRISEKEIVVRMVYGQYIKTDDDHLFDSLSNIEILHYPNLHAKMFANETKCIIGSMNFSKASEINNTELGVLLTSVSDSQAFSDAMEHCKFIIKDAKVEKSLKPQGQHNNRFHTNFQDDFARNTGFNRHGYCIRTGSPIPLNHERPFCYEAFSIWAEFENHNYPENYDHFTGEHTNGATSMATPILSKNWSRYLKETGQH